MRRLPGWGKVKGSPREPLGLDPWQLPDWADHAYRLRHDDRLVYVGEPYQLSNDDLAELEALVRCGWQIAIDGLGQHDPTTVRVLVSRRQS